MKAHITQEPRCLLLWHFGPEQTGYDALLRAAAAYRLTVRPVGSGDLGALVGDLCKGLPYPAFAPLPALQDTPALIVSGLRQENGELNSFIDAVKATGAVLPVRAAVTPTSKQWTLLQLLQELYAEHEVVDQG